jgi:hypothetical protein
MIQDDGRAADAFPGNDFTSIWFIIQHYFTALRPGGERFQEGKSRL